MITTKESNHKNLAPKKGSPIMRRNKMKAKRLLCLLMAVTMVLGFTACGDTTEPAPAPAPSTDNTAPADDGVDVSTLKVGVVMKSFDEFQQAVMDGAVDAAIELGIPKENVTTVAPNNESEIMSQVTMVEDLIAKGVDILLISVNQADTVMNVLQSAADKGVKIVTVDTDAPDFKDKVTYIGTNNEDAAYTGALEFLDSLPANSNVVILRGKLGDVNHEARTVGLTKAIEEKGHTVLEVQDANCESDKAANAMEAFLTKFPGEINAVMVTSDSMAIGAAQAIKGAGVDGISICGFDGFQAAIDLVETGDISMIIAQKPYFMGYEGVMDGFGSLNGETYDSYINPGIAMINSSNVSEFKK